MGSVGRPFATAAMLVLLWQPMLAPAADGYRASYQDFTLDYERRMSGAEYRRVYSSTLAGCARLCLPLAVCKAFSYSRASGSCALISRLSRARPRSFFVTGVKIAPAVAATDSRPRPVLRDAGSSRQAASARLPAKLTSGMQLQYGVERLGRGYRVLRQQHAEDCARACDGRSSCVSFRYVPRQRECTLFASLVDSRQRLGVVSGYKANARQTAKHWEQGGFALQRDVGLAGQDYRHQSVAELAQCLDYCNTDPQCQAFSYDSVAMRCALKQRVPLRRYRKGVISGFRQRRQ